MNRLLEGDVGSGKTIVAAIAALATVKNNFQVAFMAPTEILSQQHFRTLSKLFKDFEINIGLLTSSGAQISWAGLESKSTKKEIAKNCETGKLDIIIGTHSLISKNLKFEDLGLIIIDEQHRFGVEQRASLINSNKKDGFAPHLLAMTATPIPRTLALTIWGDLDISLINEMPANRKPIITKVVAPENRSKAYAFIRSEIKKGRQVFVICPLIAPPSGDTKQSFSPLWERKSATQEYEKLKKQIFPDLNIAMLHGKMPAKEKEKIMKDFSQGEINILVSTSVIEVGIDVPNASIMMIEGADRFGLAQLYQFRGRVGRGEHQSYCLLFTESGTKNATDRLDAIVKAKNSFELAEKDLQIRGPGDFLGFRQSGIPDYLMNALKNLDLVQLARDEAEKILKSDPELKKYPLIKERLAQFQQNIDILN
jgi:ATP-dependent DNA helicase RecG